MNIFITMPCNERYATFLTPKAMKRLESLGNVRRNPYDRVLTADEVIEMAQDADVIMTSWSTCKYSKAVIEKLPNLKMIAHAGGTVKLVVEPDAYETNVDIISGNDVFAKSVAEGALTYTLSALRRMEHFGGLMRTGGWSEPNFYNRGLFGKTVGIVGFGSIAKHFVNMIRYFDCEVLIYSSHLTNEEAAKYNARVASLEEIFTECDIISIHASRTPKTEKMVSRELMERMKPDALLVNTARASVTDEDALFELLMAGRFNAALDVMNQEPFPADHPLRKCKNVLLMPHMGGPTIDMREVVTLELCKDIARLQKGEELVNRITAEAASRMTSS